MTFHNCVWGLGRRGNRCVWVPTAKTWPRVDCKCVAITVSRPTVTHGVTSMYVSFLAKVDLNDVNTCFRRNLDALLNFSVHFLGLFHTKHGTTF